MEKLFRNDTLSKRERVERTFRHQPIDRVALHEQMSHNPGVIAMYTGKQISGFDYTLQDIGAAVRKTMDMCFPLAAPRGVGRVVSDDGFVWQLDNWTTWTVSRPFDDVDSAREHLLRKIRQIVESRFDLDQARQSYRQEMIEMQALIGETVILNYSCTGFCHGYEQLGLELFTYLYYDCPGIFSDFVNATVEKELLRIHAVADPELSPAILIPEDFATKQGPIFPPDFLHREHYPHVKRLADAWHSHGIKVLYHSDGNYRKSIQDLIACGVDGFYCLEPAVGMDIVELKNTWPEMVWAGGVDGVDLMEQGTPDQVRDEVQRQITETDALKTGGMFVATSSELNPPVKPENFKAMVEAVGEFRNQDFDSA